MRKKTSAAFIVTALVLMAFVFYSCSQDDDETMSISGRIDHFVSDLNSNPGNVYTNCHPDASKYAQAKDGTYWTTNFGSSVSLTGLSISGTTVTATVSGGNFTSQTITFTMQQDGTDNWKIKVISVASFSFN